MEPSGSNGAAPGKSERDARGRFLTGNSGGGRPKGARNKLGEQFLEDVYSDWVEHGADVLVEVREKSPGVYLRVVASLIPLHLAIEARDEFAEMSSTELRQHLAQLAKELGLLDCLDETIEN